MRALPLMDTRIDLQQLGYADLIKLGKLAAEAMILSHDYDRSRALAYCELVAACNLEMLTRRRQAERRCGTELMENTLQNLGGYRAG